MNKVSAQNNTQNMKTVKSDKDIRPHKEVFILVRPHHLPMFSNQHVSSNFINRVFFIQASPSL